MALDTAARARAKFRPSKYNISTSLTNGTQAFYNRRTGACLALGVRAGRVAASCLNAPGFTIRELGNDQEALKLAARLLAGGFAVREGFDEILALQERFSEARTNSEFALKVYATYACNLGCDYCFVGKKQGGMSQRTSHLLANFVETQLAASKHRAMGVTWFGGEPLLASTSIDSLSRRFIDLCAANDVAYSAQLVTNGTLLTRKLVDALRRWGVTSVQVTLDGTQAVHDSRRAWRDSQRSSFSDVLEGIRLLLGRVPVRLRINVDRRNMRDAPSLLDLFRRQGWLKPDARFYPYVAQLLDYTVASSGVAPHVCDAEEFEALEEAWLRSLHAEGVQVSLLPLYGFPEPRWVTCTALTPSAFVVTPHGTIHRCSFDADDDLRAIGTLESYALDKCAGDQFWARYDPFARSECRECRALPSCLGFCPRNFRDSRTELIRGNCLYFREQEPRRVRRHLELHFSSPRNSSALPLALGE